MEGTTQLCSVLCVFLLVKLFFSPTKQSRNLPPSPLALPVIGHLHLIKLPLHATFHRLSQKYGSIISLKFGSRLCVVVSSPSAVEDCFTKNNDIILANRPQYSHGKYLTYNFTTVASSLYGDHWRNLRRLCTVQIFSSARLNKFQDIRIEEVKVLLRRVHGVSRHGFSKVSIWPMIADLALGTIMRTLSGKRCYDEDLNEVEETKQLKELMKEYFRYAEATNPADLFPILMYLHFNGFMKKCARFGKRFDHFLQGWIHELRTHEKNNTMINHLLILQESHPACYTDDLIKGLVQEMLLAGTDSIAVALGWAMSNLVKRPDVLKKARQELDNQVGGHRLMDESDLPKLPYLQCIISETLRLYPSFPLLVPHMPSGDCKIGGYEVPKGTMLFINAWAIHRDPKLWDDPTSFRPERFENGKIEPYRLIPFGVGRRACPGAVMANRVLPLALGSLIRCFNWDRVSGMDIEMTAKANSITLSKPEPLELMCRARPDLDMILF